MNARSSFRSEATARVRAFGLVAGIIVGLLCVSCGHRGSSTALPSRQRSATQAKAPQQLSLPAILAQIDAYPTPKGVSAERWSTLTAALKRELIARSKDGKTISIAPAGSMNAVTDLAAAPNPAGTQATVTWTDVLAGDYNNDGAVDIGDLAPMAQYYGLDITTGPDDGHRLVNANDGNPQIDIDDLQPIANDYSAHLQGYVVWRGHFNGATTDWETTPRPNPNTGNPDWSADRPSPPPVSTRPAYTYSDDLSGVTDKANVRYKVVAYGDGAAGAESNEATMPAPPTFNVSGTVTQGGSGLAGVTMTLTPGGLSAPTATDGTYTIPNVPNGSYTLTPTFANYSFAPAARAVDVSGADMPGQDFVGSPLGYSVSGIVLSAGDGLPGVTMTLTPGGLTATTASDGSYTIPGVSNGSYTLTPSKPGFGFTPPNRAVTVSGADVPGQSFVTSPVYNVSGTVLNSGVGLPGVTMTLAPGGLNATTAADGTYTIVGVANGSYTLTPTLSHFAFAPMSLPETVSGADVTGQDFSATPAYDVSGTVLTGGSGVAGVTMTLTPGGLTATTAADGTYTITGVLDGTYTLTPSKHDFIFNPTDRTVPVSGADVTGQSFDATPAYEVSGTVLTDTGVLLGGVLLTLTPGSQSGTTVPDGSYVISGVLNGTYTLTPSLSGYVFSPPNRPVTVSSSDVAGENFIAAPVYDVSGTVLDFSAFPLAGVTLTLTPGGQSATSGADGTYLIPNVENGQYTLTPSKASYVFFPASRPVVVSGANVPGQNFTGMLVGLGASPWPKFRGNAGNTGLSTHLGAQTNALKWTYATGGQLYSSPAIASDGTLYIGSWDGKVYAVNSNGGPKWSHATGGYIEGSPAVALDGTVIVGSSDNKVYALNPSDGSVKWTRTTGGYAKSSPAIGQDGTVYVGCYDYKLYALNPGDGSVRWTFTTGGVVDSSPAIGADGTIYFGSADSNVYALDPASGYAKWIHSTASGVYSSPAIGADGTVYVGSYDNRLYALDPIDGNVKWSYLTGSQVYGSPAVGPDGTVYVGSYDSKVYALVPSNGAFKWAYLTGNSVSSSPAVGSDGTVYVGSQDGKLYAINPGDGSEKWSYATSGVVTSSPAIGGDGTVYVGSSDYNLYAFGP